MKLNVQFYFSFVKWKETVNMGCHLNSLFVSKFVLFDKAEEYKTDN